MVKEILTDEQVKIVSQFDYYLMLRDIPEAICENLGENGYSFDFIRVFGQTAYKFTGHYFPGDTDFNPVEFDSVKCCDLCDPNIVNDERLVFGENGYEYVSAWYEFNEAELYELHFDIDVSDMPY